MVCRGRVPEAARVSLSFPPPPYSISIRSFPSLSLLLSPNSIVFFCCCFFFSQSNNTHNNHLTSSYRSFCWFSFSTLLDSVESGLKPLPFLHLLPGHGRSGSWATLEQKDAAVDELLRRERAAEK